MIALAVLSFASWYVGALIDNVAPNKPTGVEDYEDTRHVALTIAGLFSPFIAFLGLYVAQRRYQTQVKQADVMIGAALQQRYVDAVNLLSQEKSYQKIAGITVLRDPAIAANEVLMASAASTLTAHIRSRGTARTEDDTSRLKRLREVQEAMKTLFFLEGKQKNPVAYRGNYLKFYNLDLAKTNLEFLADLVGVGFYDCDFSECRFEFIGARKVIFIGGTLKKANIKIQTNQNLEISFQFIDISGTHILCNGGMWNNTFGLCRYDRFQPPNIHSAFSTVNLPTPWIADVNLPTPWIADVNLPNQGRYMSLEEANDFWASTGNENLRPVHSIHFPGNPTRPDVYKV